MAKSSRVPPAVGSIPVVGDLVKQADNQAQWLQQLVEENARLVGQLPATMKTFNDSLERFNDTVARLDRMVTRVERTTDQLIGPIEEVAPRLQRLVELLDVPTVRDLGGVVDSLRKEALPALRAATDTQRQIVLLQSTVERITAVLAELPGMNLVRRFAGGRAPEQPAASQPGSRSDEPGTGRLPG